MIIGAHSIIYSKNAEADRDFFRDVLKFVNVDVGHGWLIFGLPPSEVAIHPSDENDRHELDLMCDDLQDLIRSLREREIECSRVHQESWGSLTQMSLPGGGKLGVYQPKHRHPPRTTGRSATRKKAPTGRKKARTGSIANRPKATAAPRSR